MDNHENPETSTPPPDTGSPIEADCQVFNFYGGSSGENPASPVVDEFVPSAVEPRHPSHSITESIYQHEKENGRTYHKYKSGSYYYPNDPSETDRLNFQYEMLKYAFSDKNYFAPIKDPKSILDVGTGTGQWAIEMGDEFPDAEIQGIDLSPIQPSSVPANVHFFVDDASEPDWVVPPAYFDYIHTRVLLGCFENFKDIIKRSFHYLKPGAYMESQDVHPTPYCDDGTMPDDWVFKEWMSLLDEAAMRADRPLRIATRLKRWYQEAGFVDVQERIFKMPLNPWARDKHLKFLGKMSEDNWLSALQGLSLAHFSRTLSWSKDEIEVYLVNVRKAVSDRNVHVYHKIYVVWGRKPETAQPSATGPSTAAS